MTFSINDIQHNDTQVVTLNIECHLGWMSCWMSCWMSFMLNVVNKPSMPSVIMLSVAITNMLCWMSLCRVSLCWMSRLLICYAECRYAERPYAECHYAECRYVECVYATSRGTDRKISEIKYVLPRTGLDISTFTIKGKSYISNIQQLILLLLFWKSGKSIMLIFYLTQVLSMCSLESLMAHLHVSPISHQLVPSNNRKITVLRTNAQV